MKNFARGLALLSLLIVFAIPVLAQEKESVEETLKAIEGVISVQQLGASTEDSSNWLIFFEQPIDHKNPWKGTFKQRMFMHHRNAERPMLIITDGYTVGFNNIYELTELMDSNQLYIEHRYFGASTPEKMDWKYLSIEQSAHDYHKIRNAFGEVYQDKWISTGISKGGQTALFYKYFYPQDVTATVAYVAPVPLAMEDERIWKFIWNVGTEECRAEIIAYQKLVLNKRAEMADRLKKFGEKFNQEFVLGVEPTLEIMVAEYPFSFWQYYRGYCGKVPTADDTDDAIFNHLRTVVSPMFYTKNSYDGLKPAFYQFLNQIGYYGYDVEHLGDLIKHKDKLDNRLFAPDDAVMKYDGELAHNIHDFLVNRAQNVLYIYGGIDTWSACAVEPAKSTNSRVYHLEGGNHSAQIGKFPEEVKQEILDLLGGWIGMELKPATEEK
jgi:hypothetical protein